MVAAALLSYSGKSNGNGGGAPELVFGFVALIVAIILLAPFCLTVLARFGRRAPIAVRLALRDLARYRARSGSALAAISLGVLIAVLVCVLTAQRYGNVLDYAGPNLASNQLIVYTPNGAQGSGGPGNGPGDQPSGTASTLQAMAAGRARPSPPRSARTTVVELDQTERHAPHAAAGRSTGPGRSTWPPRSCCRPSGSRPSEVNPNADILTHAARAVRPLQDAAHLRRAQRRQGRPGRRNGHGPRPASFPCPKGQCLANPVIQEVSALPAGTSAPNTVITEHAIHKLGLQHQRRPGWLIQTPHPPTAAQITNARLTAGRGRA